MNVRLSVLATFVVLFLIWPVVENVAAQESASNDTAPSQDSALDFSQPGLTQDRPKSGRYVEIEGGFMIPYMAKVPGTTGFYKMLPIPGGTFIMGSSQDDFGHRDDEHPQVTIKVDPFWMSKYEVTWGEYRVFMKLEKTFRQFDRMKFRKVDFDNQVDAVSAPSMLYDLQFTFEAGDDDNQPCASMTQYAAKQYTKYFSLVNQRFYRLPTEAEWEYACRAGTTTAFHFGDDPKDLPEYAWFYDNSDDLRHRVGTRKPNPWGLHDMYGNVSEWVLDQYAADTYSKLKDQENTANDAFQESTELHPRVCRGGDFWLEAADCRSAARLPSTDDWQMEDPNLPKSPWWLSSDQGNAIGFRIMRPLREPVRNDKEGFWSADIDQIVEDVELLIQDQGRSAFGIVDPKLPRLSNQLERLNKK